MNNQKSNQMVRDIPMVIIIFTLFFAGIGGGNFMHFLDGIKEGNVPKIFMALLGSFFGFYTSYMILCYGEPKV